MHAKKILSRKKFILVYFIATFIICWHQLSNISSWFQDQGYKYDNSWGQFSLKAAETLENIANVTGVKSLNKAESNLITKIKDNLNNTTDENKLVNNITDDLQVDNSKIDSAKIDSSSKKDISQVYNFLESNNLFPFNKLKESKDSKVFTPKNILLAGDSMMLDGLGPTLAKQLLSNKNLTINRDGKYGTGLSRPDYFDWSEYMLTLLNKYKPDLIILCLGANDAQDIIDDKKVRHFAASQGWQDIYKERVKNLIDIAKTHNTKIFWIGLPIMGKEPYNSRIKILNTVVETACKESENCQFWDSWLAVADSKGKFATKILNSQGKYITIRRKDQIHLTNDGGTILATKFLEQMKNWANITQNEVETSSDKQKL